MKDKLDLGRIVSTDTLFKTKLNYKELNEEEKSEYIDILTDEFLESADDLIRSLADK